MANIKINYGEFSLSDRIRSVILEKDASYTYVLSSLLKTGKNISPDLIRLLRSEIYRKELMMLGDDDLSKIYDDVYSRIRREEV